MTLHLPASRAAEDFARALDGTATPEVTARYADLVATATLMREQPLPTPRPEFVSDLRSQLMVAAETELRPASSGAGDQTNVTALPRESRRARARERHLGAVAAAVVLVGASAGVAAAADGSLPGDTLYPIKRGIEKLQVSMNTNDAARGAEHLRQAGTRLTEVEGLLGSDGTTDEIAGALADFNAHADEGSRLMFRSYQQESDPDDISAVREFTAGQMRQIEEIADLAPPTSVTEFAAAAAMLAEIDQQARVMCGDCSGAPAVSAPEALTRPGARDAITELVAAPVTHAVTTLRQTLPAGLADGARLAEDAARETPKTSLPGTGDAPTAGSDGTTSKTPVRASNEPVTDLVKGVTGGLPLPDSVKRVTRPLTTVTDPVTGLVDETLKGLTDGLDEVGDSLTLKKQD